MVEIEIGRRPLDIGGLYYQFDRDQDEGNGTSERGRKDRRIMRKWRKIGDLGILREGKDEENQ